MSKYEGQEKVRMLDGEFKGVFGYVRIAHPDSRLWVVLDNGRKTSTHTDSVEFIHSNYFLSHINTKKD